MEEQEQHKQSGDFAVNDAEGAARHSTSTPVIGNDTATGQDAPLKMNPEVKARWVAALRSTAYEQAKGHLRTRSGFCCLGVLCDIFQPNWQRCDGMVYRYGESALSYPPMEVEEWAGLPDDASVIKVSIGGKTEFLVKHNDTGATFAQIADAIEAQL